MRGVASNNADKILSANLNTQEDSGQNSASTNFIDFTSTGFKLSDSGMNVTDKASQRYIYIAIRRPHKPPTDADDVFKPHTSSASGGTKITTGFPIDMQFARWSAANTYNNTAVNDRVRGASSSDTEKSITLITSRTDTETSGAANAFGSEYWDNTGFRIHSYGASTAAIYHSFRRAPGFFDVVAYTGNNAARNITHNLEATPELVILKSRSLGESWMVNSTHFTTQTSQYMNLNTTSALLSVSNFFAAPTSTTFGFGSGAPSEGSVNRSGETYIAYLFATLDGISKVGSYTGTGSNIDVDCGFTAGARFVLIKRTDSSGDWYVWDSTRGIVSGDDPYIELNTTDAEVTNTDYLDPLNAGFTVTSSAPAALNTSGGTYLFLAIA